MKNLRIGYLHDDYRYRKKIINFLEEADYSKVPDLYKIASFFLRKANSILNSHTLDAKIIDYENLFHDLNLNHVDILHFYNTVSFGKTPWITSFETVIPRCRETLTCHWGENPDFSGLKGNKKIEKALEAMAGDACKKIISHSECNYHIQKDLLRHFPPFKEAIENKLCSLLPPQDLLIEDADAKNIDRENKIRFIFVGYSFFRKGGREILEAFQRIHDKYKGEIELLIISSLAIDNYASGEGPEDVKKAKQIIEANSEWIRYYQTLPNNRVLELMKESHIGLLPTYADTFGLSVLEFQAAGCPVISTNIRALPEINNNEVGWLINIPKNRLGEAIYVTSEQRASIREHIEKGLEKIVEEILQNRQIIKQKSLKAIQHIKHNHSVSQFANKLRSIYNQSDKSVRNTFV